MAKKNGLSPLELYAEKHKAVSKVVDSIELHHFQAYTSAAEAHLKDAEGHIDYSKLEDATVQGKFAEHMRDFYVDKVRQYFGMGKETKLTEAQIEMLLSAYSGVTHSELLQHIRTNGEKFTVDEFARLITDPQQGIKQAIRRKLLPHTFGHITREHIPGLIKDMGLEGKIDATKMDVADIVPYMSQYNSDKVVPMSMYKRKIYHKPEPKTGTGG